ncbi:hypothetical protein SNEBB_007166 [Seison nebaliae]|nr:hypothetical protein SNEBB_007166 [Seison nebaliae]
MQSVYKSLTDSIGSTKNYVCSFIPGVSGWNNNVMPSPPPPPSSIKGVWFNSKFMVLTMVVGGSIVYGVFEWRRLKKTKKIDELQKVSMNELKNVVILHSFPIFADEVEELKSPWISPFSIKLEVFFMASKIDYYIDPTDRMSIRHKTPFITLNGIEIDDSQFIMEKLTDMFSLKLDNHLTVDELAKGRAILHLVERSLYFILLYERYVNGNCFKIKSVWKRFVFNFLMKRWAKTVLWHHGYGRYSRLEILRMGQRDLDSLSQFLGNKDYIFGEKFSSFDSTIFAHLVQLLYTMKGALRTYMVNTGNLGPYVERMKNRFFPDWNERCELNRATYSYWKPRYLPSYKHIKVIKF